MQHTTGIEQLENEITELAAHIDAATHLLLMLIAEYDRREAWAAGGFSSCAHFLGVRIGCGRVAAREKVRVARALQDLPAISQAMARGEVSYSKVRAMTRIATPQNEADLLAMAKTGPAAHIERVVREYRKLGRAGLEQAQRQHEGRYLTAFYDEQGMLVLQARLPPEQGAVVLQAIEAAEKLIRDTAETPESPDSVPVGFAVDDDGPGQLRADALGLVAERALAAPGSAEGGEPHQVVLHMDAEVLTDSDHDGQCCIEHGPGLCSETARRLTCDAPVVTMVHGANGEPLSVGRRTRRLSTALRRALQARDRTCCFPGCTRRARLQAHHVQHWADGGPTDLPNLALLCPTCHRRVHEGGFTIEGRAPDALEFRSPVGHVITGRQAEVVLPADPVAALQARHAEQGLAIDPLTGAIDWWGEPLDAGEAVECLRRREPQPNAWPLP